MGQRYLCNLIDRAEVTLCRATMMREEIESHLVNVASVWVACVRLEHFGEETFGVCVSIVAESVVGNTGKINGFTD